MSLGTEPSLQTARAALDAARVVFARGSTATAPALWRAAQPVLQLALGRPELTGHALVGEARRIGVLTLSDAHALVGLSSWADRSDTPPADEAERLLVRESWMALEHAVPDVAPPLGLGAVTSPVPPYTLPLAPSNRPPRESSGPQSWAPPPAGRASGDSPSPHTVSAEPLGAQAVAPRRRPGPAVLTGVAAMVLVGAAGALWYVAGRADRVYRDGVDAYQRGAREVARAAFVRMAQQHPEDARPLVYLGRITREEGDLARSRRFLTTAVRLDPRSALAARELAGVMLADGQPDIARRFYVRAIERDPADRVAQGFLACALARLQRFDEARRWIDRAGPGDWQRCVPPMPVPSPGALPPTASPRLPSS
ncbi:MAG: tetratricopeptide repeat protein [Gemmatimonas sp.]|uniref:tetratricopeptide repeat protein n=1 Tax=Gemmatimonas sp. TaxID=1962908 RepID=UPI00391FACEB